MPTVESVGQANAIDDAVREITNIIAGELGEFEIDVGNQSFMEDRIRNVITILLTRYVEPSQIQLGPKARTSDPSTSKRAALENLPRRRNQHRRIIEFLAETPLSTWTAEQIAIRTVMRLNSLSTRMTELERAGWVDVVDRDSKRQTYKISTRGLLRYSLGRQRETEGT